MSRSLLLALVCIISLSGRAFADGAEGENIQSIKDVGTIFHHQAWADKWEVWPILTYLSTDFKPKSDAKLAGVLPVTSYKSSGMAETLRGEYGINDMWAVGVDLSMGDFKTKMAPSYNDSLHGNIPDSWKSTGMMDPTIFVSARMRNVGPGTLYYGLPLTIGIGNAKTDHGTLNRNLLQGGTSVAPWVGYDTEMGPGRLGVHLTYSFFLTDRKWDDSSGTNQATGEVAKVTRTITGSNHGDIKVFYEAPVAEMLILGAGVSYGMQSGSSRKADQDNALLLASTTKTKDDNGVAGLGVGAYGTVFLSHSFFLTPTVKYEQYADTSFFTEIKSATSLNATVYGTYIF